MILRSFFRAISCECDLLLIILLVLLPVLVSMSAHVAKRGKKPAPKPLCSGLCLGKGTVERHLSEGVGVCKPCYDFVRRSCCALCFRDESGKSVSTDTQKNKRKKVSTEAEISMEVKNLVSKANSAVLGHRSRKSHTLMHPTPTYTHTHTLIH